MKLIYLKETLNNFSLFFFKLQIKIFKNFLRKVISGIEKKEQFFSQIGEIKVLKKILNHLLIIN